MNFQKFLLLEGIILDCIVIRTQYFYKDNVDFVFAVFYCNFEGSICPLNQSVYLKHLCPFLEFDN